MLETLKDDPGYAEAMRKYVRAGEIRAIVAMEEMMSTTKVSAAFDPDIAILASTIQDREAALATYNSPQWSIYSHDGKEIVKYSSQPNWVRDVEDWVTSMRVQSIRTQQSVKQSGPVDFLSGLLSGERQRDWTTAGMTRPPVYSGPLPADSDLFNPTANLRPIDRKTLNPANPQHAILLSSTPQQRQQMGVFFSNFDEDVLAKDFVPRQPRSFNEATAIGFREGIVDARNPGPLKRLQLEQARENARRLARGAEEAKDTYMGTVRHLSTQIEDPAAVSARVWNNRGAAARSAIGDAVSSVGGALTGPTARSLATRGLLLGGLGYAGYKLLNREPRPLANFAGYPGGSQSPSMSLTINNPASYPNIGDGNAAIS